MPKVSNFINIANDKIAEIVANVEYRFPDEIDADVVEDGLVYFYAFSTDNSPVAEYEESTTCKSKTTNNHCVLNINAYNQEIWFSSPILGPSHWSLTDGMSWYDKRNDIYDLEKIVLKAMNYLLNQPTAQAQIIT